MTAADVRRRTWAAAACRRRLFASTFSLVLLFGSQRITSVNAQNWLRLAMSGAHTLDKFDLKQRRRTQSNGDYNYGGGGGGSSRVVEEYGSSSIEEAGTTAIYPNGDELNFGGLEAQHVRHQTVEQLMRACDEAPLAVEQKALCKKNPKVLTWIGIGARGSLFECRRQFLFERWNCSDMKAENESETDVLSHTIKSGNRENAFLSAVTAAGMVHAITTGCSTATSMGLTNCDCDPRYRQQNMMRTQEGITWRWSGCSDDPRYGMDFTRRFLEDYERALWHKTNDIRHVTNIHNHKVGRLTVTRMIKRECRCHGVSGSCEFQTCWKTMPSFDKVGDRLKLRYNLYAVQVAKRLRKRSLRRKGKMHRKEPITNNNLVFVNKSPNYCNAEPSRGIFGTKDRRCNTTSTERDNCDLLCCGRGICRRDHYYYYYYYYYYS